MSADHKKEFIKLLEGLAYSHGLDRVFSDFCYFASTSIYNAFMRDEEIEAEYKRRAEAYGPEKMTVFADALSHVVGALDGSHGQGNYHDFLGEAFMGSELGNNRTGQFFTPYSLSKMIAEMTMPHEWKEKRIMFIQEPASGSGGMVIAACEVLHFRGINFQHDVFFETIDIDERCWRMAYIQLSLIGASAHVVHGDTLRLQEWARWSTPMYHHTLMEIRLRNQQRSISVEDETDLVVQAQPDAVRTAAKQLDLFGVSA